MTCQRQALANSTMMSECASPMLPLTPVGSTGPAVLSPGAAKGTRVLGAQAATSLWSALHQVRNARQSEDTRCL